MRSPSGITVGFLNCIGRMYSKQLSREALLAAVLLAVGGPTEARQAGSSPRGVSISYQLPYSADSSTQAYLVTLAIVDSHNPSWIISTFLSGAPRLVNAENKGSFTETWNGLDENFMPVPPGDYLVKGIYSPAQIWPVDGQYHAIVPEFVSGANSFLPVPVAGALIKNPFVGDPVNSPLAAVAVGSNGVAVFYYQYFENGLNNYLIDLKKDIGPGQFIRGFGSGSAGGGLATTTDGEVVWSVSQEAGPQFVYRADQKRFGAGPTNSRPDTSYLPVGWVTSLANWADPQSGKKVVFVAERGKILPAPKGVGKIESTTESVDQISLLDGDTGAKLAQVALSRPLSLAVSGSSLFALHQTGPSWNVTKAIVADGKLSPWQDLFVLDAHVQPAALAVDSHDRFYISDKASNQVIVLDAGGHETARLGTPGDQAAGHYDRLKMMSPGKLSAWTDATGEDRILVVEDAGPNRLAEWSTEGKLLRAWQTVQTYANYGYAVDPEDPSTLYILGQKNWLIRFKNVLSGNSWEVDAVWPNVGSDPQSPRFDHPRLVRKGNDTYLACSRSMNVYKLLPDRCTLSAAIIRKVSPKGIDFYFWHDANGDGIVQESEWTRTDMPGGLWPYWGQRWSSDLSLMGYEVGGWGVFRLAPSSFDSHQNPVFTGWQKLFNEPFFEARVNGKADALHGGNELDNDFSSDWTQVDADTPPNLYVMARGGKSFSSNFGAQEKLTNYRQGSDGKYSMVWRVGRTALNGVAARGEIYGAIQVRPPMNGLMAIVDQTRCGLLIYTADGLYVDTLFPDPKVDPVSKMGIYALPGEFFSGDVVPDKKTGKIYLALGKETPLIFEAAGWSLTENRVHPLSIPGIVHLAGSNISDPPEIAMTIRGGSSAARVAKVIPATGKLALDGSMLGWESTNSITFGDGDKATVEVRAAYDPEHLYVRWHLRKAGALSFTPLDPASRIFVHDRGSDTLSLYLQADPAAPPSKSTDGRSGDVRLVFGVFSTPAGLKPTVVGLYQTLAPGLIPKPEAYVSAVSKLDFARVALVEGVSLGYAIDSDRKGYVIAAQLPVSAFPPLTNFATLRSSYINFEATLQGHNKFWWSNADGSASRETFDEPTEARLYPGSWAPAQFPSIDNGLIVRNWMTIGPFGGQGTEKFAADLRNGKDKEAATALLTAAQYPPDQKVDPSASYSGVLIQGYWPPLPSVSWKSQTSASETDPSVSLGNCAQVWFADTWIYSAGNQPVESTLRSSPMVVPKLRLNGIGQAISAEKPDPTNAGLRIRSVSLNLHQGWNEVLLRGFCVGYPPLRMGLSITGPSASLWGLRLSATQPSHEVPRSGK